MTDLHRGITRRLLRLYRSADDEQLAAGHSWYDNALATVSEIGEHYGVDTEHAVVAAAHLSPRCRWSDNIADLERLLAGQPKRPQALTRSWDAASASLDHLVPLLTFSPRARKTRDFALAILGDRHAVCVDTWTARAVGVPENWVTTARGYTAVSDAFWRGARIENTTPRALQATTWVVARGAAN